MHASSNASNARPTLVLIHGLFSSPLEFGLISQILRAREVEFELLQVPGYTYGAGAACLAWKDWVAAANEALDARFGPDQPIVLGGLRTGAALAMTLALGTRSQRVCGVASMSATFDYDGVSLPRWWKWRGLAYALGLAGRIAIHAREPFGIKNPKIRKWVERELEEKGASSVGPSRLSLRSVRESERLHAHVRTQLAQLQAPLLVLHATDDDVCSLVSVKRWVDRVGEKATLIALDHSYQMITIDNDRQRVAHELADFVGAPKRTRGTEAAAPRKSGVRVG
jgi:carboxylesterase